MATTPNGKRYIGQTKNTLRIRVLGHLNSARNTPMKNRHWARALLKYGKQIEWVILEDNIPENMIDNREVYYISLYETTLRTKGYNILPGGNLNKNMPKEIREKIAKSNTGKIFSKEHRHKIAESHKGIKTSPEVRARMSLMRKGELHPWWGRKHSEETKLKMSNTKKGENCVWWGKHHTDETKAKIAESNRRRVLSPESKKRMSDAQKLRFSNPEARKRMSDAKKLKYLNKIKAEAEIVALDRGVV